MKWQIVNANVLDWCREYDGPPFHAMLTDPPYELGFMGKSWDKQGIAFQPATWAALAEHLLPGAWIMAFASSRGHHRLACALEDAGMVIQPSIFIEGVGLVDCAGMIGFATGQAFPKASRIDTRIDAEAGMEREQIWYDRYHDGRIRQSQESNSMFDGRNGNYQELPATPLAAAWEGHRYGGQVIKDCLSPVICAQKPWHGRRLDCIVETGAGALNVDAGRIQATNRPARISVMLDGEPCGPVFGKGLVSGTKTGLAVGQTNTGRWPASLILSHHPLCRPVLETLPCPDCGGDGRRETCGTCGGKGVVETSAVQKVKGTSLQSSIGQGSGDFSKVYGQAPSVVTSGYADADGTEPVTRYTCARYCSSCDRLWTAEEAEPCTCGQPGEWACSVRRLDAEAGEHKSGGGVKNPPTNRPYKFYATQSDKTRGDGKGNYEASTGGPSRFYLTPDFTLESIESEFWADTAERLATGRPVFYTGKASRRERDAGLEDLPAIGSIEFSQGAAGRCPEHGKTNPSGANTYACGCPIVYTGEKKRVYRHNPHPTIKPLSLCVWLSRLLAPPPQYAPRRLLVPFCGTGSEMIGAILSDGWEEIVGIDSNTEYCALAESRARFWHGWHERIGSAEPKAILKAYHKAKHGGNGHVRCEEVKQLVLEAVCST